MASVGDSANEIKSAAEAANIAQDIEGFPENYNTTVGERGMILSEPDGETQTVSPPAADRFGVRAALRRARASPHVSIRPWVSPAADG